MENVAEASRAPRREADSSVLSSHPSALLVERGMYYPPMRFNFLMRNIDGCLEGRCARYFLENIFSRARNIYSVLRYLPSIFVVQFFIFFFFFFYQFLPHKNLIFVNRHYS